MPDNNIPSDVVTGQNDATLLATGQDTERAASDIFQNNPKEFVNPNGITQPEAPKGLYGTVNPGEDINADRTSYDYNANFYNSTERGLQAKYPGNPKLPDILLPQSETSRFSGNDYGFDINRNNESFYADHQNAFKMLGNAGANLVGKTAAYVLQNAGFILGAPAAPFDISNMTDNFLTRAGDYLKQGTEEHFPIYKSDKYQNGNIWQKLGTLGWWTDDATDRLALTAAMFIPGIAEAKGFGLFGTVADEAGQMKAVGMGAKALQSLSENPQNYGFLGKTFLSNLYKAANNGILDEGVSPALKSYAKSLSHAELYTWNIIGQSALNAKETQEAVLKATGDKEKAANAAMKSFWETVPLALAGSLVEIPQMFSTTNTAKSFLNKVFDKESGDVLPGALELKSPSLGKTLLKSIATGFEHGQNESMQVAVSRFNEESAEGKDKRSDIKGIWGDFLNNIHDPNGQNNIALGTIQGIFMTLGGRAIDKINNKDQADLNERQNIFSMVSAARMARKYYNGDFVERDEKGNVKLDADGNPIKDQQKMADAGLSLASLDQELAMKKEALENKNYVGARMIDYKALANFAYNFLSDPKGTDYLSNILTAEARNSGKNPDRVNDTDQSGNQISAEQQLQANLRYVKAFKKINDAIEQRHAGFMNLDFDKNDKEDIRRAANFIQNLKVAQYNEGVTQAFFDNELYTTEKEMSDINSTKQGNRYLNEIFKELRDKGDTSIWSQPIIEDPSDPMEERYNDLIKDAQTFKNLYDESRERYKALVDKKAQRQAFEDQKAFDKKIQEEAKAKAEEDKKAQDTIEKKQSTSTQNSAAPAVTSVDQNSDNAKPPTKDSTVTRPEEDEVDPSLAEERKKQLEKIQKLKELTDKKNKDIANAKTPQEKKAINDKYFDDRVVINKGDQEEKSPEEQDKRFKEIQDLIPNSKTIRVDEHGKLFQLINDEAKKGNIDGLHEVLLVNALDEKNVIGTALDTTKDLEDEKLDKTEEEKPADTTEEEVTQDTQTPTDDNISIGNNDSDFNPESYGIDEYSGNPESVSYIAFDSSNKTVTQEELQDENGQYTGQLDEDSYKQFKQGYLRFVVENGMPEDGIHGKIIKDNENLPHSKETQDYISKGGNYGSVLIITDSERNPIYFDDNYNSTTEPSRDGYRPIVYSFNSTYWNKSEALRALIGENRTGKSFEDYIKQYEDEQKQQDLARQLSDQGKEIPVDIKYITDGVVNKSKTPVKSSQIITEDMNYSLFVPALSEKFDATNPDKNKYVLVGNQALVNGSLYAHVVDKTGISSYARLIPNTIAEIPELAKEVKELLTHSYSDENDANIAADYLKDILFLNKAKRPAIKIAAIENSKFAIMVVQDNVYMDPDVMVDFALSQYLNILKKNVDSDEYLHVKLEGDSLKSSIYPNYRNFALDNTTTRSIGLKDSEGNRQLPINNYAVFDFLDSPDSMEANLHKEEGTPPGERSIGFKKNELSVWRHAKNPEDRQSLNSGWNDVALDEEGIGEARELGEKFRRLGINSIVSSPIFRAVQTAREASKTGDVKTISLNDLLKTWNIGQFTSTPDADFDENYFVTHPDEIEKDGKKLGETFNQFLDRALKGYKHFQESKLEKTAIITHSRVIRIWDAFKENNELWNNNAVERYLNLPGNFAFTSVAKKDVIADNSTLTKTSLRRLSTNKETDAERIAREQNEKEKGLKAKTDVREERPLIGESEIAHVNRLFGETVATRVNNIVNSDARALWTTSGIKLLRDARQGDGYHEAWHHFSQLYLTQGEKRSLYDEARKKNLNFKDRDGRKLNSKTASDFDIEEFIADDFRDYVESDGKSRLVDRPYRNSIFRKILDFLKRFFFGEINVAKLYDDLYKGNLNSYEPSINNAMWGKLNSRAVNQKGDEIVNNQKAAYFRGVVDYLMGDQLLKAKASVDMLGRNKELAEAIYKNIYNDLVSKYFNPLLDKADKGEDINQELAEDLYKVLTNWEDFVQYHKKESKLFIRIPGELTIDVPESPEDYTDQTEEGGENYDITEGNESEIYDESEEEKEVLESDKVYDRAGNEQSSMEAASIQTKGLIRMLPEVNFDNGNFTIKLDQNGFPKLCDYAKTWNNLAYNLSNIDRYGDMYSKMSDPEVMRKIPELSVLIKHLPDPNKEHTPSDLKTITAFRTDFNRAYVGIYSGRIYPQSDGTIKFFLSEETKRNTEQVSRLWTANFNNKLNTDPDVNGGRILIDAETGKYYINPANFISYDLRNKNAREDFLKFLGFSFSEDTKKQVNFYNNQLPQLLKDIQDNINARNENGNRIYNPIFDLKTDVRDKDGNIIVPGLRAKLDAMVTLEARYTTDVPSMSYRTAEGEMIHGLTLNHTLSIISNHLNRARSYDDIVNNPAVQQLNYKNNPYVRGSVFLNYMFDLNTGKRYNNNIIVGNYNGLKTEDREGNIVGFSTTSLNIRQKAIFDINSLLIRGVSEVMRTESSKTAYFVKLERYTGAKQGDDASGLYLPVRIGEFNTNFNSPRFKGIMIDNYLYDELHRMKTAKDIEIFKKDQKLMDTASKFNLFSDILNIDAEGKANEELKNRLKEEIQTGDIRDVINKYRKSIENAIENFFTRELKSFKDLLNEENIAGNDIAKEIPGSLDQKYRAFLANNFILNTEYTKLFNGDTIYQAHYKDYFKRSKGDVSTGLTPITDDLFARYMKEEEHNTFSKFIGSKVQNNYKTTRTINFVDDERASKYLDIYAKDLKAVNPKISDTDLKNYLDKYAKLNIGDGQGWITMDFYRQFLKSINNWNPDQEKMYRIELAKWRLAHADFNIEYTNEQKETDRDFLQKNKGTYSYFPPLKIQYNGPITATGTFAPVMDKFSVAPLIPSIIQDRVLEDVHNEMLKHGVGYAKFVSGTKKYKAPATSLYSEEGYKTLDLSKSDLSTHFLEYLKEQIHTNPNIKTESIFGSQVRKLIEANIFSGGVARPIDIERHEAYKSYIKGIKELGKQELFKDLSINQEGDKLVIKDVKKFISTLQEQADLRDLNDNIKDYIQFDKNTEKMKYPLETSLNRRAIQDLIMGIIDRRLRLQKVPGDQLIQISSSGFQSKDFKFRNATEDEVKKYGTNGLRFYHLEYDANGKPTNIRKAQVKVALIGGFEKLLLKTHPDGKRIGTIERLNELLKDDNWMKENSKSVSLVGYRIPTQGHNSMENLEVAEFLPPHAGSVVIVPAEIVAKAGSDFDIDKLSIFRPSLDENGNMIDSNTKEGYSNKIMNLFSDILSDPANFEKLIRPNDTDLIKPDINDIAVAIGKRSARDIKDPSPYSRTQIYRYKNNLRKFETLLSAKRLLSIFAVNNTFTTLMQQAGITMNSVYGVTNGATRNVRMLLLSAEERGKVLNKGRIDLSNKYDVEGNLKQDYLSQLINATVDAASDDFAGYVNLSYENVGILCLLENQGVPFDRAMWFINQPTMLRYYSDLRRKDVRDSKSNIQARLLGELRNEDYFEKNEDGLIKLNRAKFNKAINEVLNSPVALKIFLSKEILKKTTVKVNQVDSFLANEKNKTYNALVFSYFLSLGEQAQIFRSYQQLLNFDTSKTRSPLAAWQAFKAIETLKVNRMFDENEYNKMVDKSVIGAFDNRKLIATIGARLMPVAFNPRFIHDVIPMINKEISFKNKNYQKRYIGNLENQWIEYVVKSMSKVNDIPLQNYAKSLLEGRNNLARRFNDLISKYPSLRQDYAFVNRLRPNFPNRPDVKKSNLEVYRLFENSTDDQNRYISEFRELINLDSKKFNPEQTKEIRNFFADLAILGFVQSGFSKSNISFQELIPYEQLSDMFKTSIQNLNKYVGQDKTLMAKYVKEYTQQFGNNNRAKNVQSWRGRDYYLSKQMEEAIVKKEGEVALKQSQVNTKAAPAPYENIIKTQMPEKPTTEQIREVEAKQQEELLNPQKTERQYWPGEEVKDSDDEFKQTLGKALFKYAMDRLGDIEVYYLDLPDNFTEKNLDDIFENEDQEKYYKQITSQNFEKMINLQKKLGDNILADEDKGEYGLNSLKNDLSNITIANDEGNITTDFENIKSLFNYYKNGDIEDQFKNDAEKILSEYGLLRYRDYNPNQINLDFPNEVEGKYYTDEEYKEKLKNCKG